MIVGGDQRHGIPGARRPDIGEIEDLQRLTRREPHRLAQPADYRDASKGGSVYPCFASRSRTPSSARPCVSTASASRPFAATSAAVVRRCSIIKSAITAAAIIHGRMVFLNSVQMFMTTPG